MYGPRYAPGPSRSLRTTVGRALTRVLFYALVCATVALAVYIVIHAPAAYAKAQDQLANAMHWRALCQHTAGGMTEAQRTMCTENAHTLAHDSALFVMLDNAYDTVTRVVYSLARAAQAVLLNSALFASLRHFIPALSWFA